MIYRCPLCFTELTEGMQFNRYCTFHKKLELIVITDERLNEDDFIDEFFCPEPKCDRNNYISDREGVFISHFGCEALNPFWDRKEILQDFIREDVPLDNYYVMKKTVEGLTGQLKINHWQIGMLRAIGRRFKDYPYMWFPPILIKAVAMHDTRNKLGSIVALVGGKRVGKTVLALQAMNERGYIKSANYSQRISLGGYVFSRNPEGSVVEDNPLFETLYLDYLLARGDSSDLFLLAGTQREPGDLKAVFIRPSPRSSINASNNNSHKTFREKWGSRKGFFTKAGVITRFVSQDLIMYTLKSFVGGVGQIPKPEITHSPWHTVIFYDVAGEDVEKEGDILKKILDCSGKIAILINAAEVFDPKAGVESIITAHACIKKLIKMTNNKKRCLVITQVDRVLRSVELAEKEKTEGATEKKTLRKKESVIEPADIEAIKRTAENLNIMDEVSRKKELESMQAILTKYLRKSNSAKKKAFAKDIIEFDDIFFLWTENLPKLESGNLVEYLWKEEQKKLRTDSDLEKPVADSKASSAAGAFEQMLQAQTEAFENAGDVLEEEEDDYTASASPKSTTARRRSRHYPRRESKRNPPESYGIARFICWCLDQPWSSINQPSGNTETGES